MCGCVCVCFQTHDMLPFMSKSHIVLGGALPPSRPWCPSRSFKCAVGRAHVHCLEPSLSFSLCLWDNDPWAVKQRKKAPSKTGQQKKNFPSRFLVLALTRAVPQRAVCFAAWSLCFVFMLLERPSLNLWGFGQKDSTDSLIQSAEPQLHHHDG